MRGCDIQQAVLFSSLSPETRIPATHPLRPIRQSVDRALSALSAKWTTLYAHTGRPSIAPEKLLRALLLQVLYRIRSERVLMEQLDYNLLFRWFVGLDLDAPVWDVTVFTKNRDRLLDGEVATGFFEEVLADAKAQRLLSDEYFTVDGTLIEAGRVRRASNPRAALPPCHHLKILAIPVWTSGESGGRTPRMRRRPIWTHGCTRKQQARRRRSVSWGMS
jgi:transposase